MQDWLDIDFAIREGVDFIAVSFVKSADVIKNLKSYLNARADKVSPRRCALLRRHFNSHPDATASMAGCLFCSAAAAFVAISP